MKTDTQLDSHLFQSAVQAARGGEKPLARVLFQRLQRDHPGDEQVWMWSAAVAATSGDSIYCLNQALRVNPENPHARLALEIQMQKAAEQVPATDQRPPDLSVRVGPEPSRQTPPDPPEALNLRGSLGGSAGQLDSRRLVLVADDSATVRRVVGGVLERRGYRVATAADGLEALAALNRESPGLILLDASMPRMDGYQVCKVLKQNPETSQIPVLLLSGNAGLLDRMKGTVSGAAGYLEKPFSSEKLLTLVQRHSAKAVTSR